MTTTKKNNKQIRVQMGATPTPQGVTFRVWAPFAEKVFVTGSFNDWSKRNSLKRAADGVWETLVKTAKPKDEYKYIIINGQQEMERIDPYAKHVTNSVGNAIIEADDFDWGDDKFTPPALNELIIYELHIGTFLDEPGGGPGDLGGVIERLPYLQELGVNAIQLMPPVEFPGGHSWGYNPSHIFAIESDYGGPTAFKALVKAAHAHGMAVIFDVVYNHFGPGDLDLWRFDGWSEEERGGIYFYNDIRGETPWGATRPDYGRPQVRQFIMDNALMWLNDYHVDGLRFDATSYIRNIFGNNYDTSTDIPDGWSLLQQINEAAHNLPQPRITIAEDLQRNEWITKTTGEGGAGFDAQWAAEFVHPVRQALIGTDDAQRDLDAVAAAIGARYNGDAFDRVIYTESHDEVANGRARLPEDIHPGQAASWFAKKRSMLGAGLVFTAPGIPMIFQGQEFLEDEWFRDQDPLDWTKTATFKGIVQFYRDLIRLRRNVDGATKGLTGQNVDAYHINNGDKVLAFQRWDAGGPGDSVVVVANFANQHFDQYTIGLPAGGTWQVRLNSDAAPYDAEFGNQGGAAIEANAEGADGQTHSAQISLPPYTLLILSQDK